MFAGDGESRVGAEALVPALGAPCAPVFASSRYAGVTAHVWRGRRRSSRPRGGSEAEGADEWLERREPVERPGGADQRHDGAASALPATAAASRVI